ncbi:hypothetical protein ILUMI_18985 [Ignelater luminosus]|uniref:Uncharacterized protein n=1 Tax=Ignelater luminosus TaxID=2038154 RepID=A0A8K0G6B4_IGNLU|nr:hypothetical protein ILUMI_18985 [Ignelater luminosus]
MENILDTCNSRSLNHQLQDNLENIAVQKLQDYEGDKFVEFNEQENCSRTQRPEHVCVLELATDYDVATLSSPLRDSCFINDDIEINNNFLQMKEHKLTLQKIRKNFCETNSEKDTPDLVSHDSPEPQPLLTNNIHILLLPKTPNIPTQRNQRQVPQERAVSSQKLRIQ